VRVRVLGPLTASSPAGPVDLRGPRHRAVLARLLIARGRVVPAAVLIDDLWGADPPDRAAGALQTFVGALRRALEPDRPPRTPARVLITSGPGYAIRLGPDAVDAWRFEAVATAPAAALADLDEALSWWQGPAFAEVAAEPWAVAEVARLDGLRRLAVRRRAEALLAAGRAAEAVAGLGPDPADEADASVLARALYLAGRQGDALDVLRRVRVRLAGDLGLDPSPSLRQLESDILRQAVAAPARPELAGRSAELALLAAAEAGVRARGRPGLVLVSGDAGVGKTALLEAYAGDRAAWTLPPDGPPAALTVLDDLHEAGEETLRRLSSVLRDRGPAALVIAAYRTAEAPAALTAFLARAARTDPVRVTLGALGPAGTAAMLGPVPAAVAATIHRRSGGNAFFVRELGRLYAEGGDPGAVPPGVRDVVRHRLARLPAPMRAALDHAAVIGLEVDLDVLDAVHGDSLDAMEMAARHGFVSERGPQRFRFSHALVRDAVYETVSQSRRARWHRRVAEALERLRPSDVDGMAGHFAAAGDPRAAAYARAAAERAEQRFAPGAAARWWRAALCAAADRPAADRLDLLDGLARALAVTGDLAGARKHRAEALDLAESLGEPALTARVVAAYDIPALWTDPDDPVLARRIADAARRLLDAGPELPAATRSRLLSTIALELRSGGGPDAVAAAGEAEAIARDLDDPAVLALALNARFLLAHRAADRDAIGAQLTGPDVPVPFRILGHLIRMQARAARADFAGADAQAAAADELADRHEVPLVAVFTRWYRAMRDSLTLDVPAAEAGFRAAAAQLAGTGMTGLDGVLDLALLAVRVHRTGAAAPDDVPAGPRDLLFEARAALRARAAIRRGDRAAMARAYADLLPAAGELAGAGSGLLTLGPVDGYLAELRSAHGDLPAAGHE
jgi:DNA-binding SARP family transcriptional activator